MPKVSVRLATTEDIPALLPLMRDCHDASVYAHLPFDEESAAEVCRALIESEDGAIFFSGAAFLALAVTPMHFNLHALQALEIGFYGPGGGELIEPAKAWAGSRGAIRFVICNEQTDKHAAMDRFYSRKGFKPCAVTYEGWL